MTHDETVDLPNGMHILASAVQYFIAGSDNDFASALIPCSLEFYRSRDFPHEGNIDAMIRGPRASYLFFQPEILDGGDSSYDGKYRYLREIISALVPRDSYLRVLDVRLEVAIPDPDWREQAARIASGKMIVNQAPDLPNGQILFWNNLRFRSEPERRIANALDAHRVLFFPNSVARLSAGERRINQEPDFLVCDQGKWGILEIDGMAYHPSAARDHSRDRLFRAYGIRVIERFEATECNEAAPAVVQRFLNMLQQNG